MKVVWYYSRADWWDTRHNEKDPSAYEDVFVNHLKELAAYPAVKGFWFDGLEIELYATARELGGDIHRTGPKDSSSQLSLFKGGGRYTR